MRCPFSTFFLAKKRTHFAASGIAVSFAEKSLLPRACLQRQDSQILCDGLCSCRLNVSAASGGGQDLLPVSAMDGHLHTRTATFRGNGRWFPNEVSGSAHRYRLVSAGNPWG